jgi:hypothetical protein
VSIIGGLGDLDGLECRDIADGDREEGKEEREVRRLGALPLELAVVSVVPVVPLVVGRCIVAAGAAALVAGSFAFTVALAVAFGCLGI